MRATLSGIGRDHDKGLPASRLVVSMRRPSLGQGRQSGDRVTLLRMSTGTVEGCF